MAVSRRWHSVRPSEFAHEQQALDLLRKHLPDRSPFLAWSNFEFIAEDGSVNEIDALILGSDCVWLVEIKHWAGCIGGNQTTWTVTSPTGRIRHEENPLLLTNRKARKLKSLLQRQAAFRRVSVPYIQAAVFLSEPGCELSLDKIAAQHVYLDPAAAERESAPSIVNLFHDGSAHVDPARAVTHDTARAFARAMDQLGLRKRAHTQIVGDYRLTRLITENDSYQDWEAQHQRVKDDLKRIRIFTHARGAAAAHKRERKHVAQREYELLRDFQHEAILTPRQLTECELGPALVYDFDPEAQRLDHLLGADTTPPDIGTRLETVRYIAEALAYAHKRGIQHRALSPWTIELQADRPVLRDWQSGTSAADGSSVSHSRMTMHAGQEAGLIADPQAAVYVAPEVIAGQGYDPVAIDIFSLGALAYAIFSRQHPAANVDELLEKCSNGTGLLLSAVLDGAPDSLQDLIQLATDPNPDQRPSTVSEFLAMLDQVEDELTTPDPIVGANPADASKGDLLSGGFRVLRRLGSGSTSWALQVEHEAAPAEGDGPVQGILKVAKSPEHNQRLLAEAETLQNLTHSNIVRCYGTFEIDGAVAIFMEQAGDRTLGRRLREQGPLSLDLLERFGDELLSALVYLERQGVNHRDIKPENIGVGENRKRALTLKLFDFSLAQAPTSNIRAGTPPYLDPFLRLRKPPRWDLQAERFAAAMTLHEMATGTLPLWGSAGQDPVSSEEPVSLDEEKLDPSIRSGLAVFFRRALERDPRQRFDNADDMLMAWKSVFRHIDQTTLDPTDPGTDLAEIDIAPGTSLAELGLAPRTLNAAERIGATTVEELLGLPGIRFWRNRGISQRITRELRKLRDQLQKQLSQDPTLAAERPEQRSINRLVDSLTGIQLGNEEAEVLRHWLGLATTSTDSPSTSLGLCSRIDVAEATGSSRSSVEATIDKAARRWARNSWMTALRDELSAFLQLREFAATLHEAATHLLARHGCTVSGNAARLQQTCAVLQAALEVEAARQSARFALYRGAHSTLLVATPELGGGAPSTERAKYALELGRQASMLAATDPLRSARQVAQALAQVQAPPQDQPMSPERQLRLAQATAPGVALSSRLELYPVGMPAERALRLGANSLLGASRLTVPDLQQRIASRFPQAQPLPGRPQLDELLASIDFPLHWQDSEGNQPGRYVARAAPTGLTSHQTTLRRFTTTALPAASADPQTQTALDFDATMQRALASGRVLMVTAELAYLQRAAAELQQQHDLAPVSLERLLLNAMRSAAAAAGADWQVVLRADAASHNSPDWRRLRDLVQRVLPQVAQQILQDQRPLLVQHLGPLVRYGQPALIQQLRDAAADGSQPARILLLPGDADRAPVLDGTALPVITPADWAHLPRAWLENRHRATPPVKTPA